MLYHLPCNRIGLTGNSFDHQVGLHILTDHRRIGDGTNHYVFILQQISNSVANGAFSNICSCQDDLAVSAMIVAISAVASQLALDSTRFNTYWLDSLDRVESEPPLDENTSCDLLIVGGGFCGLWAAIQAKEKNPDRDIVLIEAKLIANGASGRPAAIMSTSVMHGIDNTERMFPGEVSELEKLGQENIKGFQQTLERYDIDCDVEWSGEMKVSVGDQGLDTIEEDYKLYSKYGHNAVKLDKDQIQAEINSPVFHGGVWSKNQSGTVHPGKLVRALKRVALDLGVKVYESTPHISNHKKSSGIEVITPNAGHRTTVTRTDEQYWLEQQTRCIRYANAT